MADGGRRSRRKRSEYVGRPNELGALLADLRTAKRLSLRQVEEATGKERFRVYVAREVMRVTMEDLPEEDDAARDPEGA